MLLSPTVLDSICRKAISRLLDVAIFDVQVSKDALYSLDHTEYVPVALRYYGGQEGIILLALSEGDAKKLASLFAERYRLATSFQETDAILAEFLNIYAANVVADISAQAESMRISAPEIAPIISDTAQMICSLLVTVTLAPDIRLRFLHCPVKERTAC